MKLIFRILVGVLLLAVPVSVLCMKREFLDVQSYFTTCVALNKLHDKKLNDFIITSSNVNETGKIIIENN